MKFFGNDESPQTIADAIEAVRTNPTSCEVVNAYCYLLYRAAYGKLADLEVLESIRPRAFYHLEKIRVEEIQIRWRCSLDTALFYYRVYVDGVIDKELLDQLICRNCTQGHAGAVSNVCLFIVIKFLIGKLSYKEAINALSVEAETFFTKEKENASISPTSVRRIFSFFDYLLCFKDLEHTKENFIKKLPKIENEQFYNLLEKVIDISNKPS